jgi:hypothetical protein
MNEGRTRAVHTSSERHNACPEIARVKRHVDARERDSGEAALELNVAFGLLLRLSLGITLFENLAKHLFDLLFSHLCNELVRK